MRGNRECICDKVYDGELQISKTNFCQKKNGVTISNIKIRSRIISRDMMGSVSSRKDGNYRIKYNVYGYDEAMIEQLQDFILEGDSAGNNKE